MSRIRTLQNRVLDFFKRQGLGKNSQIWAECSRLFAKANCVIYYNACILPELLERAERRGDREQADQIKRISPVSWNHVNFYG